MRDVLIKNSGMDFETLQPTYTVECGCKTFLFRNKEFLLNQLKQYLINPEQFEDDFNTRIGCPTACPTGVIRKGGTVSWNGRAEAINNAPPTPTGYCQVPSEQVDR